MGLKGQKRKGNAGRKGAPSAGKGRGRGDAGLPEEMHDEVDEFMASKDKVRLMRGGKNRGREQFYFAQLLCAAITTSS